MFSLNIEFFITNLSFIKDQIFKACYKKLNKYLNAIQSYFYERDTLKVADNNYWVNRW